MKRRAALLVACIIIVCGAVGLWRLSAVDRRTDGAVEEQAVQTQQVGEMPEAAKAAGNKATDAGERGREEPGAAMGSQQLSLGEEKLRPNGDVLAEHALSLRKQEKKGFEVGTGVTVKNRAVQVQLDENSGKMIEVSRKRDISNSDYQVMLKQKF